MARWLSSSSGSIPRAALAAVVFACLMAIRCGGSGTPNTPTPPPPVTTPPGDPTPPGPTTPPVPSGPHIFIGAGDIAMCGDRLGAALATGKLMDGVGGTVFTLGDNAYDHGTAEEFRNCYEPAWGRFKTFTRPVTGNHEYEGTANPMNYFDYFGSQAGTRGQGWYSFEMGEWHAIALNSSISLAAGTPQGTFLRNDLAQFKNTKCTIAYWHHPLFTSGQNGPQAFMRDTYRLLHESGVDVVLTGHDHLYERFAPQNADGGRDPNGIRQFVVGTGGAMTYQFTSNAANSEKKIAAFGVLKLTLRSGGYDFEFLNARVPGTSLDTDAGSGTCH